MTDENKQDRPGQTIITSVSLSKEYKDLIDRHGISPTWAVRKGIAIELFEMGVNPPGGDLNSELNRKRLKMLNELLVSDRIEELTDEINELMIRVQHFKDKLDRVRKGKI